MTRHDDNIRLRHMLDHTREAITIIEGRHRADLDSDRLLELGLVRLVEIIGEAAARVIGLSDDLTILVSQKLNENEHTEKMFFDFTGAELRGPRKGQPPVSSDYSLWHRENCFRE